MNNKVKDFEKIIEALLFASSEPLTQKKINLIFDNNSNSPDLESQVIKLNNKYSEQGHSIEILNLDGGYQIRTKADFDYYVRKLLNNSSQSHLSQAALETLSIISYKQPISKPDVESIRGVDCSGVLKTLLTKLLIKIKGRDNSPGRPLVYATTNEFLQVFGLNRLSDLPKLKEVSEILEEQPALTEQINAFK
ncbi:MAG: SMC-Scp complex subunit ScpB [Candidatus Marinimicrobia bacterium]|nr:SMC-Scp complex subunit ScpB [Candidatus Neomarinimicrobiota bacterium]